MIWSWSVFWQGFTNPGYGRAAWASLWSATVAEAGALVVGFGLALLGRSAKRACRAVAATYVWLWRGTPLLVQLLIVYFGLPEIGIRLGVVLSAVLTLVANEGAYLAVIVAASMATLPRGQLDAAKMLGLSRARAVRYVELPQAARSLVPILGNQYNAMMKTTSLLSIIAFSELLEFTQTEVNLTYQPVEAFAVAAIYYLAMTTLWSGIQLVLEKRLEIPVGPRTSLARRLVLPAGS